MYLWSFQAFIFLNAGESESTFILWGLSEWKANEGNAGFVGEMNFLSGKQISVLVINMKPKPLKKRKKGLSLGQGFHFAFQ